MTNTRTFKEPSNPIFFKFIRSKINAIRTEIQLRNIEADIKMYQAGMKTCKEQLLFLENERKKCVSWRLKHL